jgi:hypothetical protein
MVDFVLTIIFTPYFDPSILFEYNESVIQADFLLVMKWGLVLD